MKRDFAFSLGAVSAGVFMASAGFSGAAPANLRPSLQPGYTYTMSQEQGVNTKMTMGELSMDQDMDFLMVISMVVRAGEGDVAKTVTMKYDRLKADMAMMGQNMSFDSDEPGGANPLLAGAMGAVTKASFTASLGADDKVIKIESEGLPEAGGGAGGMLGGDMGLGAETMEALIQSAAGEGFPDEEIEPGHEWDYALEIPLPQIGRTVINMHYKYEGVAAPAEGKPELPKVSFTGELEGTADIKLGTGAVGMKLGEMETEGVMYFDADADVFSIVETQTKLTMSMDNGETSMEAPATQKSVMTTVRAKTAP